MWTLFLLTLGALVLTADALSVENGRHAGLLFLTDLKGYDVVLANWRPLAWALGTTLLAVLPVFSILLLSGASRGEVARRDWQRCTAFFCPCRSASGCPLGISSTSRRARGRRS